MLEEKSTRNLAIGAAAGLTVERWSPSSIRAEPLVTRFYDGLAEAMEKYVPRALYQPAVSPLSLEPKEKKPRAGAVRKERAAAIFQALEAKKTMAEIVALTDLSADRILVYIEKFIDTNVCPNLSYLVDDLDRADDIKDAFSEHGLERLKPVFDFLGETVEYETLKLVRIAMRRDQVSAPVEYGVE